MNPKIRTRAFSPWVDVKQMLPSSWVRHSQRASSAYLILDHDWNSISLYPTNDLGIITTVKSRPSNNLFAVVSMSRMGKKSCHSRILCINMNLKRMREQYFRTFVQSRDPLGRCCQDSPNQLSHTHKFSENQPRTFRRCFNLTTNQHDNIAINLIMAVEKKERSGLTIGLNKGHV